MQSVLFLAFKSHTGTAHFGHTERVVGFYTQHIFDAAALFFGMRFRSYDQCSQFGVTTRINPHFLHYLVHTGCVTGNGVQGGGSEIGDEFQLAFGVSGSGRYSQHSQPFSTILKAQPAGEHSIAGRVLENISRT